jgi:hypothetical protein
MTASIHTKEFELRELAAREGDGIAVSLLWNPADNSTFVLVSAARTGDSFEVAVANRNPLDVFYHPFAYASPALQAA